MKIERHISLNSGEIVKEYYYCSKCEHLIANSRADNYCANCGHKLKDKAKVEIVERGDC